MGNDVSACCNADNGSVAPHLLSRMQLDESELDSTTELDLIKRKQQQQQQQQQLLLLLAQESEPEPGLHSQKLPCERQQLEENAAPIPEKSLLAEAAKRKVAMEVEQLQQQRSGVGCTGRLWCSSKPKCEQ